MPTQSTKWNFVHISCGREQTLAVLDNGGVFGWGGNGSGHLPSSLPEYCTSPSTRRGAVEIRNTGKMKTVCAGYGISLGITEQNSVHIWGSNAAGIAGRLDLIKPVTPQLLATLNNIQSISASEFQFGAIDQNGKLYTCGMNVEGALGRDVAQFNAAPGLVTKIPPIMQLAVGLGHMLAIDDNGIIYVWGNNGAGQLGLGHLASVAVPQVHPSHLSSKIRYSALAAGTSHSLELCLQGRVYSWGSNHHGQLGYKGPNYSTEPVLVKLPEPINSIAAGMHFSVAVGKSGKVYAWGWNAHGQLGVCDTLDRHSPTQLKYINEVHAVSAGETHVVAIASEGLFGWGGNTKSQLGKLERQQKFPERFF